MIKTKKIHLIRKGTTNTCCGCWADIMSNVTTDINKVTCKVCLKSKIKREK